MTHRKDRKDFETPDISIDPDNGNKAYSDVSVFSRECQSSRGKQHEGEF